MRTRLFKFDPQALRKNGSSLVDQLKTPAKEAASASSTAVRKLLGQLAPHAAALKTQVSDSVSGYRLEADLAGALRRLAEDDADAFGLALKQVYGAKLNTAARAQLVQQALDGEFPLPAAIRFVDPAVLKGAEGAYSPQDGGIIFLSSALKRNPDALRAAFTEEVGHHLDRVLGGADAVGDEGELFQKAVSLGRPLTAKEVNTALVDRDAGTIEVDGLTYEVEFRNDIADRSYEAVGGFSAPDRRAGAEDFLRRGVDAALIAKFAAVDPAIDSIEAVQAHCESNEIDYASERSTAESAILGDTERETFLEAKGIELAAEAQAATLIVCLRKGEVLPETTELSTPLPASVLSRIGADPALSTVTPTIEDYGQLFAALLGDTDSDSKTDIDSLQLGRFIPGASQQKILRAFEKEIPASELKEQLRAVGFDNAIIDGISAGAALRLEAPTAFGLSGFSAIDKTQQQFLLRTGRVFVDADSDGKVSDGDVVSYVDANGAVQQTQYKDLPDDLRKLVAYNLATAQACEEYAALPSFQRMRFPHWHSSTGLSDPEKTNEEFWKVSTSSSTGQPSWELADGKKPSESVTDVFSGNGAMYTTECAQGRCVLRLKGLLNYYKAEHGEEAGTFKFNSLFAKTEAEKTEANTYFEGYESFIAANPDKGWADYTASNAAPEIEYALEVSRHYVLGAGEAVIHPWKDAPSSESAAGDTGYFHNYSVSIEGVKIGYVGENVIDLGYQGGTRRYWGHPGGIKTESSWQASLSSYRIKVQAMSEFGQYFSKRFMVQDSLRVTDSRVKELEKKNAELETDKPEGWEDQVKDNNVNIAWWRTLHGARSAVAEGIDPDKIEDARSFYTTNPLLDAPEDMQPLYNAMTAAGQTAAAAAFDHLDDESKEKIATHFGVAAPADLSQEQKGQAALQTALTAGGTRLHSYLRQEGLDAITNMEFERDSGLLESTGHMGSKTNFASWLTTEEFKTWYEEKAGAAYESETDLAKMTKDEVKTLVELAFPMVKGKRTVYAEVNRGTQVLSDQMATLLKEGKLPDAEYALDSPAVMPL